MSARIVLQTHQLDIGYPKFTVAQDINVSLYAGELVCLIGPNGAGKSTLMRTLAAMQTPIAGYTTLLEICKCKPITNISLTHPEKLLFINVMGKIAA